MIKKIIPGIAALALGIGAGLLAGWYVWPVSYSEAAPHLLEDSWKNEAIWLTAQAFAYDRDLEAAQARLRALNAPTEAIDLGQLVLDRAERAIQQGLTRDSITALARLAAALGARTDRTDPYLTP